MTIEELCRKAFQDAEAKGWYEPPKNGIEVMALIHSEVSEAIEAMRTDVCPYYIKNGKPEGELAELADVVIRVADYCGSRGLNLERAITEKMKYNETRPHRHGGKLY